VKEAPELPADFLDPRCPWCGFPEVKTTSQGSLTGRYCPSCHKAILGRCCDCGKIMPDPGDFKGVVSVVDGPAGTRLVAHIHCVNNPTMWLKWWREVTKTKGT